MNCPACLSGNPIPFSEETWTYDATTYRLVKCSHCNTTHTLPLPSDGVLASLYKTSFDYRWYTDHYDAKLRDCRMRIQEYGTRLGNRVLDFGGGVGYFSKAAQEAGLESITWDPYVNTSISAGSNWDCVVALHVLEHSNDLDRTICQIKNVLSPGGRVVIAVPNAAGRGYQKLGMRWVWAQPPLIHIFHFTETGLSALLTRHNFRDIEITFHERWDANSYCDIERASYFRKWDAAWGLRPFNALRSYRRMIAGVNSRRRFRGLEKSLTNYDPTSNIYSELQVTAVLGE